MPPGRALGPCTPLAIGDNAHGPGWEACCLVYLRFSRSSDKRRWVYQRRRCLVELDDGAAFDFALAQVLAGLVDLLQLVAPSDKEV